MPYIITVNQPGCLPESDPTAVATIEEARETAREEVARYSGEMPRTWPTPIAAYVGEAERLPEHGGTVGPLPDGYVIDVRRVTWDELAKLAQWPEGRSSVPALILDAYNKP